MANADPTVIGSQIGDGNAAQMGADSRAHEYLRITSRCKAHLADRIQKRGFRVLVLFLVHLLGSKSSNKNRRPIPNNLHDLPRRNLTDINLKIGISIVPGPAIESADDGNRVESAQIGNAGVVEGAEHVDLGAADVGLMLVVNSVLVEPVVESGFEIDVVAEVAGAGRGDEEVRLVGNGVVAVELFAGPLVVVFDQAERESAFWIFWEVLWLVACRNLENNILFIN